MKRPHADLIIAWANGATIQVKVDSLNYSWVDANPPAWNFNSEYRIKPEGPPQWQEDLRQAVRDGKVVEINIELGGDRWVLSSLNNNPDTYDNFGDIPQSSFRVVEPKSPVTRWLWAYKTYAGKWCIDLCLMTQEEADSCIRVEHKKLENTAVEFDK